MEREMKSTGPSVLFSCFHKEIPDAGDCADQFFPDAVPMRKVQRIIPCQKDRSLRIFPRKCFQGKIECDRGCFNHHRGPGFRVSEDQKLSSVHCQTARLCIPGKVDPGKNGESLLAKNILQAVKSFFHGVIAFNLVHPFDLLGCGGRDHHREDGEEENHVLQDKSHVGHRR